MKRIGTIVKWSEDFHFGQNNAGMLGIVVSYTDDDGYKIWWANGSSSDDWSEWDFTCPDGALVVIHESR